jgi:AraC-like DNA-binding protein
MDRTEIVFHTPGPAEAAFPYHAVAAGLTVATPGDAPVGRRYHQHVLILTRAGEGRVEVRGRVWRAGPGSVVWLDTARDYAHGCAPGAERWSYLWAGVQGFGLDALRARWEAMAGPVAQPADPAAVAAILSGILRRMRQRGPGLAAGTSAAVAALVALLLEAAPVPPPGRTAAPDQHRTDRLAGHLRLSLTRRWTVPLLAAEAGLSPAQLHRLFRAETGLSPMEWLRRERITAAKALLLDPDLTVQAVAEAVGYPDPFHFSRDFRRLAGRSPRGFRASGGT